MSSVVSEGKIPIVIDNGTYQCRAGFAGDDVPKLVFRNHVAKLRKDKTKKEVDIQVGNEIENVDNLRFALKSQFDRNVVVHMDIQQIIFDHILAGLGVPVGDGCVEYPVILSEAYLNPSYCRNLMSELMFETYQVPFVAYTLDCLPSLEKNFPNTQDALIVSLGYRTIHVIPLLNGRIDPERSRRINIGGFEITFYLHKLLLLKYPAHLNTLSLTKAEELIRSNCTIAEHYQEEISKWTNHEYYDKHVLKIQVPKRQISCSSQTQIDATKERRKEAGRKLCEINLRRREEKLVEDEERLVILNEIKESIENEGGDISEVQRALEAAGVSTINELLKQISSLKSRILKTKEKMKPEIPLTPTNDPTTSKQPKLSPDITDMRDKRAQLLKKRFARKQRRTAILKRRSLASQERMRILSQLAKPDKDGTFGMNDDDWDIYKTIQKDGRDSDSEEEQEELVEIESLLKVHDPGFAELKAEDTKDEHDLHIGLERWRAPELIFQPSLIGEYQAGVPETIDHILKLYSEADQSRLVSNIFVTGGPSSFEGLLPRLHKEIMEIRPFQSSFDIKFARDPSFDAWKGMSEWGANSRFERDFISKSEYEEKGPEYCKEHSFFNTYSAP